VGKQSCDGFGDWLGSVLSNQNYYKKYCASWVVFRFVISGSFYLATEFRDTPGFLAGLAYGVIIDFIATKYGQKKI